ncbi:MAG: hypothetical protein IJX06_04870 [Clostridia bacterium]|nr:hypothetical protein [Clostridia bacterium]
MKKMKLREKIMLMFSLALVSILFLVPTFSKYVAQKNLPFEGEEHLDYTVNSVFVVRTQSELFAAINQGYTYVQLDKDIENPLIVTQKAETLDSDLILDLNGIEIQRNGYEPILNIKKGVRLTVVDTSAEQTGGLYNPVGSVFNITGGTLTVVTGTFESGPRYSEYYTYNNGILDDPDTDGPDRTIVEDSAQSVNFFRKSVDGEGKTVFTADGVVQAPIIKSYPEKTGDIEYNHGNLYFDEVVTKGDLTIRPDTYCYYRTSEDVATDSSDVSMADWYYTYYVSPTDFSYVGATGNLNDHIEVTIYGYENTIKQASAKETPADYYAAIQMQSGTLDVQNGGFYSYFGVNKTACVNSQGGTITVKEGNFSSRIPNATTSTGTVGIKEIDELAFGDSYFNIFKWNDSTTNYTQTVGGVTYNGRLAKQGESFCILNGGSANVSIGEGNCYSSNNNIISMQGGSLSIGGGTFTKKNTIELSTNSDTRAPAIYMKEGQLDISNTKYDIYGKYASAIYMLDGKMTVNKSTYNIDGSNTIGIYSAVAGDDNFIVNDTNFTLTNGDNQNGIIAVKGKVQVSSSGTSHISTSGANGVGIRVSAEGSVSSTNYAYDLDGKNSKGILAESDAAGIDVTGGKFTITGDNSFGIESLISGDDKFNVTDADITMTGGTKQTGIYSANGRVNVKSTTSAKISIAGAEGKGIHVLNNGSVVSSNYSYTLNGASSKGIYAENSASGIEVSDGNFTIQGNGSYGIQSYVGGTDKFTVTNANITMTNGTAQTGIYSANGRVNVSADSATISIAGAEGKGIHVLNNGSVVSSNYSYTLNGASSKGIYAENSASGIEVSDGNFTIQGNGSYGIQSYVGGTDKFTVTNANITMTNGTAQTGIYSANGRVNVSADSATISIAGAEGKGIHVANGGSVYSKNYAYTLKGATSYGIYSVDGQIDISGGNVTLASNDNCYGIYATAETTNAYAINTDGVNIAVGAGITADKTAACEASIGIYMYSQNTASKITLNGSKITSYELGIVVDGGQIDISGTGGEITTENASAIALFGGSITFNEGSEYAITSKNTTTGSTTNSYAINLPRLDNYVNTDGIYVSGGQFYSRGDLQLTHTGLQNDQSYNRYSTFVVRSYAVRVEGGSVEIEKANITANAGGGIYCSGGNMVMGNADSNRSDIIVNTNGYLTGKDLDPIGTDTDGWRVPKSVTGGNAIELSGETSNITIYEGTYTAQYGNGVATTGKGQITIKNGEFYGWMNNLGINSSNLFGKSGPGAYYGLKVIGGATVNIENGTFDGGNGGAFVTGIDTFNSRSSISGSMAKVYIYSGVFGHEATYDRAAPLDGFNVYDMATVIFGASGEIDGYDYSDYNDLIKIYCQNAPLAVNGITLNGTGKEDSYVDIYYGEYGGKTLHSDAIGNVYVYNTRQGYTTIPGERSAPVTIVNNSPAQFYA